MRHRNRHAVGLTALESVGQDVRYGIRTLRKDLGFALVAILILGLGIGSNTAVFSVVNTVLLSPLPFNDPERLVWITNARPQDGPSSATSRVSTFESLLEVEGLEEIAAYNAFFGRGSYGLTGSGEPERLVGVDVAQNLFPMLGIEPAAGRHFSQEECQLNGPDAVLLSHGLWERRFAADPDIVGSSITLNDRPHTVVGIMPRNFDFASVFTPGTPVDIFVPLRYDVVRNWGNTLAIVARLKSGASLEATQAESDAAVQRLMEREPEWGTSYRARLFPLSDQVSGPMRQSVLVLWSAVGLVLLIVCANLSNLLLARAATRDKEMAVRAALGAGRIRIARQLLTESVVLASVGAMLGLALAYGATRYLANLDSFRVPLLSAVQIDATALAVTLGASMLTALLVGLLPALQVSRFDLNRALKNASRGSSEGRRQGLLRSSLVVAEVALACVLLVGAGLLLRSFSHVLDIDLGFRTSTITALRIDTSPRHGDWEQRTAFLHRIVEGVSAVPGVHSAAATDALPLDRNRSWALRPSVGERDENRMVSAFVRMISQGYVSTMGIPIVSGREFSSQDRADTRRVVLINQTAASHFWPDQDPVGQLANVGGSDREIVGVVGDVHHRGPEVGSGMEVYMPLTQVPSRSLDLVVRSSLDSTALAPSLRRAVRSVDPLLPARDFRPLTQLVDRSVSPRRFSMNLLGVFAAMALLLALLGIYGVISYSVSQRKSEIGIRMALGASAARVRARVIRDTFRLAAAGIAIGTVASLALSRVMASLLFGVSATDAMTFSAVIVALAAMAVLAGYLPARRASRIDPTSALRSS